MSLPHIVSLFNLFSFWFSFFISKLDMLTKISNVHLTILLQFLLKVLFLGFFVLFKFACVKKFKVVALT